MNKEDQEEMLFQIDRKFSDLGRGLLTILDHLKATHANNFDKLHKGLPVHFNSVINMSDYLDPQMAAYYRKCFLDVINGVKRDLVFTVTKDPNN